MGRRARPAGSRRRPTAARSVLAAHRVEYGAPDERPTSGIASSTSSHRAPDLSVGPSDAHGRMGVWPYGRGTAAVTNDGRRCASACAGRPMFAARTRRDPYGFLGRPARPVRGDRFSVRDNGDAASTRGRFNGKGNTGNRSAASYGLQTDDRVVPSTGFGRGGVLPVRCAAHAPVSSTAARFACADGDQPLQLCAGSSSIRP